MSRVFLWVNSGCNARCRMCDIWREQPGQVLEARRVARWVPEWLELGVVRVVLCGEPLLHPDIGAICEVITTSGIRLDVLTNGILLARRAHEFAERCDNLVVSLDGPPETHDSVRGRRGAFERLAGGVRRVREVAPGLPVDARCAVHRHNAGQLRRTVEAARRLGVRSISFSATDLHNEHAFRREGRLGEGYAADLGLGPADLATLAGELDALERERPGDFATGFVSDSPARLRRILLGHYKAVLGLAEAGPQQCNAPWTSAVVEYDGTVRPCFPLPAYGRIDDRAGLDGVVNGRRALAVRRALDVATNPTCQGCVCPTVITAEVSERWRAERSEAAIVPAGEALERAVTSVRAGPGASA